MGAAMKTSDTWTTDLISCDEAGTLPGLFLRRCERTPGREAYRQFDAGSGQWQSYTWAEAAARVARWQQALAQEGLRPGERVALVLPNCVEWMCFDLAAQALGLVVVPLYTTDSPENRAYILGDAGARLLLVADSAQWQALLPHRSQCPNLTRVLCLRRPESVSGAEGVTTSAVDEWLPASAPPLTNRALDPKGLATIVYTSGTTGRPKGVMLSHHNILWNADAVLKIIPGYREDVYLSFLPLSHTFERTVGYYIPIMTGSCVAYARSLQTLAQDLLTVRPTMLVSVPRVYEQVYAKLQTGLAQKGKLAQTLFRTAVRIGWQRFEASQGRAAAPGPGSRLLWPLLEHLVADKLLSRLGGRLRLAVSGGAPLYSTLSQCFLGLGLPLLQGYGLTEHSPIVTGNLPQDNVPDSVGVPLPGVEVRLGDQDELLVRSPSVMLGYWNHPDATRQMIDGEGWLHTGDQARIAGRHVRIVGRLKDILVMSTGEKVPPADLEMALIQDPLIDQALVLGEGKPYLAALLVVNREAWRELARSLALDPDDPSSLKARPVMENVLKRVRAALAPFPGHARVRTVWLTLEPWSIDDGLVTPTMKLRRSQLEQRFAAQIRELFAKHAVPGFDQ